VIGAYQEGKPGQRTVFVSTHLISEFEGLIDEFTIIDGGRDVLTLDADAARERYQKVHARFAVEPVGLDLAGARVLRRGRDIEVLVNGDAGDAIDRLRARSPEAISTEALTLEEIFVATLQPQGAVA
jgi:ABC-type multidrug transport system ATPase subunit